MNKNNNNLCGKNCINNQWIIKANKIKNINKKLKDKSLKVKEYILRKVREF